jgi:hypothetical protein
MSLLKSLFIIASGFFSKAVLCCFLKTERGRNWCPDSSARLLKERFEKRDTAAGASALKHDLN